MKIHEIFQDKILTVSNLLTVVRLIAAPFLGYYIYKENITGDTGYILHQMIIVVIIIISDYFDGFLARLTNQVTKLGQFIDPVADKFAGLLAVTFLVIYKGFPLWVYIVALLREVFALIAGIILYSKMDVEVKPNWFGKLSACSLAFAGAVFIMSLDYSFMGITLKNFSVFLIILFYLLGGIQYFKTYARYYLEQKA